MAAAAARAPSGRVSDVFEVSREREGAYDFLENDAIHASTLLRSAAAACFGRCSEHGHVFVPVDGTSLTLVDRARRKGFGSVGSSDKGIPGINVMSAIAVDPSGVPLGLADMAMWARPRKRKVRAPDKRPVAEKETQRWVDAIVHVCARAKEHASNSLLWFQLDREADSWPVLTQLEESGSLFTVRSCSDRRIVPSGGKRRLRDAVRGAPVRAIYELDVGACSTRTAHRARLEVRTKVVTLDMHDYRVRAHNQVRLTALLVREVETVRAGEKPVDWLLLTNASLTSLDAVWQTVFGYSLRWRIEEFHRTWKRGGCNVEQTQLRAFKHVEKWATILAAVAMRIERLKHLARQSPEEPASIELSDNEIKALILLKMRQKKLIEVVPDGVPTIGVAVHWIAELGGYTGKSSGGPPGAVTIGRGFEKLLIAAEVIAALEPTKRKKKPKSAGT